MKTMGIQKKSVKNLFAGVFGIACLLITGAFGYAATIEMFSILTAAMMIAVVFTMWMVYVGVFTDLATLEEIEKK
jgi:fatty acid desaturase